MIEFLIILALIWLVIASISDLRKREVPNWLNFSLIIFALIYKAFYSVYSSNLMFFIYGLIGLGIFVILAYGFYYARVFAGGDAKLLMGLGIILSISNNFYNNLINYVIFIFLLLFSGSLYGLVYSFFILFKNKKKFSQEFSREFRLRKNLIYISLIFVALSMVFVFYDKIFLSLPFLFLSFPFLFIYAKAIESCMIVEVSSKNVTLGDWLHEEVKIGKKKIKPYWEGLSEEEVKLLKKYEKKVKIKQGIPFVPGFLIAFILFLLLRESLWSFFQLF